MITDSWVFGPVLKMVGEFEHSVKNASVDRDGHAGSVRAAKVDFRDMASEEGDGSRMKTAHCVRCNCIDADDGALGACPVAVRGKGATVLPRPEAPFAGKIGPTYRESVAHYPQPLAAPKDAPNVLVILTDDTGFGHAATFGGAGATPTLDRLAANGLRYNRMHTTALCSPTRAALLTGRNHHSVGTGVIMEMGTGYPGYTGIAPNTAAGLPQILRMNGYATGCFGKWHNTPATEVSPAGPFDR